MLVSEILNSGALLLVLLNPFLIIIYLIDVVQKLDRREFGKVLTRAGFIASAVFCTFAVVGDAIFNRFMQAEFASFQIFGGIIFVAIGLQFVFQGPRAIELLRGESQHLACAIAMPVLIGPGTISASIVIGRCHDPIPACLSIIGAVAICLIAITLLKLLHDFVRPRNEPLIERYIEIAGRVTALFVGTIAIEMIMQGIRTRAEKF